MKIFKIQINFGKKIYIPQKLKQMKYLMKVQGFNNSIIGFRMLIQTKVLLMCLFRKGKCSSRSNSNSQKLLINKIICKVFIILSILNSLNNNNNNSNNSSNISNNNNNNNSSSSSSSSINSKIIVLLLIFSIKKIKLMLLKIN